MTNSLVAGPWIRGAHSMEIAPRSGRSFEQTQAVVLESAHYWTNKPFAGFDLDHVHERYLAPDNVEAWRRRAIALLDEQFAEEGDEAIVLSFAEQASLSRVQAYWCKLAIVGDRRWLRAVERFEVRPAR
jgi:hypothetical protein